VCVDETGTGNLWYHLEQKHKAEYKEIEQLRVVRTAIKFSQQHIAHAAIQFGINTAEVSSEAVSTPAKRKPEVIEIKDEVSCKVLSLILIVTEYMTLCAYVHVTLCQYV
jgi:hypothetical protein